MKFVKPMYQFNRKRYKMTGVSSCIVWRCQN